MGRGKAVKNASASQFLYSVVPGIPTGTLTLDNPGSWWRHCWRPGFQGACGYLLTESLNQLSEPL